MLRKILYIAGASVLAVLAALLIFNFTAKNVAASAIQGLTGVGVSIKSFHPGIFLQEAKIKGLTLYNPEGFPKGKMSDIGEIDVKYSLIDLLKGKISVPLVSVHMKAMIVIKNEGGKLNIDSLKFAKEDKKAAAKPKKGPLQADIGTIKLSIDKVVYKDYSGKEEPIVSAWDINMRDREISGVDSADQVAAFILVEAVRPMAIKSAAVYGATAILGVSCLPVGVAMAFIGKDSAEEVFNKSYKTVFAACLKVMERSGEVTYSSEENGLIEGKVSGGNVSVEVSNKGRGKTAVVVYARKFMMPKPEMAGGVLYKISEEI